MTPRDPPSLNVLSGVLVIVTTYSFSALFKINKYLCIITKKVKLRYTPLSDSTSIFILVSEKKLSNLYHTNLQFLNKIIL